MKSFLRVTGIVIFILIVIAFILIPIFHYFVLGNHEHYTSAQDPIIEVVPDCTNEGSSYRVCNECGEKYDLAVLPALGHNLLPVVKENEKLPDCENGGHYDLNVYCSECDYVENERVTVSALGHKANPVVSVENYVSPDCLNEGSFDEVIYCTVCNEELDRDSFSIPANGHKFNFFIEQNDGGELILSGECTEEECGHKFDASTDTDYTYEIEKDYGLSVLPTCEPGADVFVAKVYYKGEEIVVDEPITYSVVVGVVNNHVLYDKNIVEYAQYDEQGRIYYNYSTIGINVMFDTSLGENHKNIWDSDGFAQGVFKCSRCGNWIVLRIYNDLAENSL